MGPIEARPVSLWPNKLGAARDRSPFRSLPVAVAAADETPANDDAAAPAAGPAPALMEEAPDSASELSANRGMRDMALAGVVFCANSGYFASIKLTTRRK